MRARDQLRVRVHDELVLDAGTCEEVSGPHGPERLIRSPANLRGQPGVFVSPQEWKERAYITNDEVRAKTLPAWKEWFNANIVAK